MFQRLQNFTIATTTSVSHIWDATTLHLENFLIMCLCSAQFNPVLKPLKPNSDNIQLEKSPAQTSNTVGVCLGTADSQK